MRTSGQPSHRWDWWLSTPTLIGAIRHTARYLHWGIEPVAFLTVLSRIWTDTPPATPSPCSRCSWPTTGPQSTPPPAAVDDEPTPGVGYRQREGLGLL
jgi:hypothetical protein